MRTIAVFDFDGTLTQKDTFLEFIKYVKGPCPFYFGFLLYSPFLIAYKLGLYPNWKVKQQIFTYFFKGMSLKNFSRKGYEFSKRINHFRNDEIYTKLQWHKKEHHVIYVISASIEEWIKPWCEINGVDHVLATQVEVDKKGLLTGRFLTKNCYGKEKVNRLLEKEPNRNFYYLYAYGDSKGDKEMLDFADKSVLYKKK